MSSRALRKAQKQREEEAALKRLEAEAAALEASDDEDEDSEEAPQIQKSAFAALGDVEEDDDDDEPEQDEGGQNHELTSDDDDDTAAAEPLPVKSASKRTRKQKKKKNKKPVAVPPAISGNDNDVDEIDAALAALRTQPGSEAESHLSENAASSERFKVLAVDMQNLHAENEMRRLFGRSAAASNDREDGAGGGRRRNQQQRQMAGLAAAVGREGQLGGGGQRRGGLGQLGLRRNPFIQGNEDWPIGTSGGLSMEVVSKNPDGTIEYRFVHNTTYQQVQVDFDMRVRSMDPEQIIHLLRVNPYHISALLQVSEIAKQERDVATAGTLLERALFTFGRSLHSTFVSSLSKGTARLDFRRPENREFFLAVSRYINNLNARATYRTIFEWAKLLLSLDPTGDPYGLSLLIDQFALRARQPQQLMDLASDPIFAATWKDLPNIQFSLGLAYIQTSSASKGKQLLFTTASKYPWLVARLFQDLNVDAPPGIWGQRPRSDWETLYTELYAVRAADIWAPPEAHDLLVEIGAAVPRSDKLHVPERSISLSEARSIILFSPDKTELIALLPRDITARLTSASDPLAPEDDLRSYELDSRTGRRGPPRPSANRIPPGMTAEESAELLELFSNPGLPAAMGQLYGSEGDLDPDAEEIMAMTEGDATDERTMTQQLLRFARLFRARQEAAGEQQPPEQLEQEDEDHRSE